MPVVWEDNGPDENTYEKSRQASPQLYAASLLSRTSGALKCLCTLPGKTEIPLERGRKGASVARAFCHIRFCHML